MIKSKSKRENKGVCLSLEDLEDSRLRVKVSREERLKANWPSDNSDLMI